MTYCLGAGASGSQAALEDLTHLQGPLTEDAVLKNITNRFYKKQYWINVGTVLVCINPFTRMPGAYALPANGLAVARHLQPTVQQAYNLVHETGQSQTIVLSGYSGSGKTHAALSIERLLFETAGGSETDTYKHLQAAFTVIRPLGLASTKFNVHASRMGYFIENHVGDGAIYRAKIHTLFLDQNRLTNLQKDEKNFHIFYQLLAGLNHAEKAKYYLEDQAPQTLQYLNAGNTSLCIENEEEKYLAWKSSLSVIGIALSDLLRVLSAILLLGNVSFRQTESGDVHISGQKELQHVASLLGVPYNEIVRSLTAKTKLLKGQMFVNSVSADAAGSSRDALARALYTRAVSAVCKRANSSNKRAPTSGHVGSTDSSNDSTRLHEHMGRTKSTSSSTPSCEGFIGIVDMFGFEDLSNNGLEQLCINLTAETLQHYYNTHIFRSTEEACIEESIQAEMDVTYTENAGIIELVSSQRTGIFSLLDTECHVARASAENLLQKLRVQHNKDPHYSECSSKPLCFLIKHSQSTVCYNGENMLSSNVDSISGDIVAMFRKETCKFGFVSHMFAQELKLLQEQDDSAVGLMYRISPTNSPSVNSHKNGTLSKDYHARLDNMLQTLIPSRPHFVQCVKSNSSSEAHLLQRDFVMEQIRAHQILQTVHLMAAGFPHRSRYRAFNNQYRILVNSRRANLSDLKPFDETKIILDNFLKVMDEACLPFASAHWALGTKHIFLSESARQQLELLRGRARAACATVVQACWRRRRCMRRWPLLRRQLLHVRQQRRALRQNGPRHRLSSTPRDVALPESADRVSTLALGNLTNMHLDAPPPLPKPRTYTVQGNVKMSFPQDRVLTQPYSANGVSFSVGANVKVVGTSVRRGFFLVETAGREVDVPQDITEIKNSASSSGGSCKSSPMLYLDV